MRQEKAKHQTPIAGAVIGEESSTGVGTDTTSGVKGGLKLVGQWTKQSNGTDMAASGSNTGLVLSGGCARNALLSGTLWRHFGLRVHVPPHPHDAGLTYGALWWHFPPAQGSVQCACRRPCAGLPSGTQAFGHGPTVSLTMQAAAELMIKGQAVRLLSGIPSEQVCAGWCMGCDLSVFVSVCLSRCFSVSVAECDCECMCALCVLHVSVCIVLAYLSGTFITCQLCGFWHFSVVSAIFASACKHVVTWGGVCVYFLKSARKRHFRNVWVWGGGVVIFQRSTTHGTVHTNTALHRLSIFIQNHCHCQHCFFQAGRGPH